jgi:hypothetical protein
MGLPLENRDRRGGTTVILAHFKIGGTTKKTNWVKYVL